jgi:thiol-disulfide isomerase/thioredoxin
VFLILFSLAAFVAGVWGFRLVSPAQSANAADNSAKTLANVSFPDLTGKVRSLSEWEGKILVVNFWATWCPPCKEEMPEFDKLQKEYSSRGVQFIGIALDEPKDVEQFLRHSPVGYPILIGEPGGVAWAEELGNAMQVLPFTVVFDQGGHRADSKAGPYTRNELVGLFDRLGRAK